MPHAEMKVTDSEGPSVTPHAEFVHCLGAPTHVLKYGRTHMRGPGYDGQGPPQILFMLIPGNPGVMDYYRTFMAGLYQAFKGQYSVWGISHAGHCVPPPDLEAHQNADEHPDVFGLDGQVEHKRAFLREHVGPAVRLVLIGHSIGCHIILEILKRDPQLKVIKSVLLFPTIERMAESPSGRVMTPILCRLRYLAYPPILCLSFLLPLRAKTLLASVALWASGLGPKTDPNAVSASLNLFSVHCAANSMYMASQEMYQVTERDNVTIQEHLDKLIFYYGMSDHWCPVEYYHDMKRDFPAGDVRLCEKGIRHAFVLDSSLEVAQFVHSWIKEVLV
ncbi:lipid droplet-associated hydrolase [Petromyzon marinus]|uniref:Lipid droplet-associated hydrolase n=2 Tax=Petromyzon marinus TaxID=7757 RepID=A0AAJ7X282_PETMA|nr:lipid droplet-associated hydrolase [Petromyzon marinus]